MSRRAAGLATALALGLGASQAAAQPCSGPRPGWETSNADRFGIIVNRVAVSGQGTLLWNGAAISRQRLRQYLALIGEMEPRPFTLLQPAPDTDCAFIEAVRDAIEAALPCPDLGCGEWAADREQEDWRAPDGIPEATERDLEAAADAAAAPKR